MLRRTRNIMQDLSHYASPKAKLSQMVKKGEVTRLCRGVYSTSPDDPKLPAAQLILSPSYISFETALSYHQMIPENVYAIISAGFDLKKEKKFNTPYGLYWFRYTPSSTFASGQYFATEKGYGFRMATREKALCDLLYKIRGMRSFSAIENLLFEDLRIDDEDIHSLDWKFIEELAPLYHSTTLDTLITWKRHIS